MHPFAYYLKGQLERIGYQMEAIGEKPAAITMEFKGVAYMLHDRFAVVYLREAPADSELIRGVFDYHKMPVLFVVDHAALAGDLLTFVKDNKSPPLWIRALHAIYYGRVYVWHGRGDLQALHFDWDKHEANYSESIAVEKIILTETDSLLRDYPGHFKIARFNDHAFWKGPRPTPNARQQAKEDARRQKEQYYKQEEFWRDEFKRSQYQQPPPHNYNQQPPPNVGDAFRDAFNRIFEEEMRRQRARQQQTYNQRPNRYSPPTGDQWFTLMMQGGTLKKAREIFKDLARKYHPNYGDNTEATIETMKAINVAFDKVKEILS